MRWLWYVVKGRDGDGNERGGKEMSRRVTSRVEVERREPKERKRIWRYYTIQPTLRLRDEVDPQHCVT